MLYQADMPYVPRYLCLRALSEHGVSKPASECAPPCVPESVFFPTRPRLP